MLTTAALISAAKLHAGIPSNYKLARALDVPEKTVSRWNAGHNLPDDENAAKLAQLAGLDAGVVVASIRAQRSDAPHMREFWEHIAQRLQGAGAVVVAFGICAVLSLWTSGVPDAGAYVVAQASSPVDNVFSLIYIVATLLGVTWCLAWLCASSCARAAPMGA